MTERPLKSERLLNILVREYTPIGRVDSNDPEMKVILGVAREDGAKVKIIPDELLFPGTSETMHQVYVDNRHADSFRARYGKKYYSAS